MIKNIFFIGSVMTAAIGGCSTNEIVEKPANHSIVFRTALLTRGVSALNAGQFNILGYQNPGGSNTMIFNDIYNLDNNKYKKGSSAPAGDWTGMYYYDGISDYAFYGYGRTNATTTAAATAFIADTAGATLTPEIKLAFVTANDNRIDLVTMATGTLVPGSQIQNLGITFRHALARVRFTAYTETYDPTGSPIRITKIEFKTAKNSGEVLWTDFGTGMMTATGSKGATFTLTSGFQSVLNTTETTPATTIDEVFYVVPQALRDGDLTVYYTVNNVAASRSMDLSDPGYAMVSGRSYNFNIKINLNEITFNANLEDWAEWTNTNLN